MVTLSVSNRVKSLPLLPQSWFRVSAGGLTCAVVRRFVSSGSGSKNRPTCPRRHTRDDWRDAMGGGEEK